MVGQTDTRAGKLWSSASRRRVWAYRTSTREKLQRAGTERLPGPGPGRLGDSGGRRGGRAGPERRPGVRLSERVTGLIPAGGRGPRWLKNMHGAQRLAAGQAPGAAAYPVTDRIGSGMHGGVQGSLP